MTEQELNEIQARADAAHPGPWLVNPEDSIDDAQIESADGEMVIYDEGGHLRPDAVFIANARADVPRLIAEVRRLRGALRRTRWEGYED